MTDTPNRGGRPVGPRPEPPNIRSLTRQAIDFKRWTPATTAARLEIDPAAFIAWLDGGDNPTIQAEAWRWIGRLSINTVFGASVLTQREVELLQLMAEGLTNKEIAGRAFITDQTVKNHITNIFRKFGCGTRMAAVREGARLGWIRFP